MKRSVIRAVQLLAVAISVLSLNMPVMASQMDEESHGQQPMEITVPDYTGDVTKLKLCCDETIYAADGEMLAEKDADTGALFSKEGTDAVTSVNLVRGVRYYVTDLTAVSDVFAVESATQLKVSLSNSADITLKEGTENTGDLKETDLKDTATTTISKSQKLFLSAKAPSTVASGELAKYVIDELSVSQEDSADAFLLQCDIPEHMTLDSVYTGTYSQDVSLQLLCKTEKEQKWHSWAEGISSLEGNTFKTQDLSLAEDDRICAFAICANEVPSGFMLNKEDPCIYYTKAQEGAVADDGNVKLSAYVNGKKQTSESVYQKTQASPVVQTGDEGILIYIGLAMMIGAPLLLLLYFLVRHFLWKDEVEEEKEFNENAYRVMKGADTKDKMSELLQKRPG